MNKSTADIVKNSRKEILTSWIKFQMDGDSFSTFAHDELSNEADELISALITKLASSRDSDAEKNASDVLEEQLNSIATSWTKSGLTPRETINYLFNLKEAVLTAMQHEISDPVELYSQMRNFDKVMDNLGIVIVENFIGRREKEIFRQAKEIVDLNTPIIELWKGMIAVPIIGTLDSSRADDMMNELLQKIAKENIDIAILDISGVPTIDSAVADHLAKLVSAVRLLGAECIISGIRPEIAQTIVHLGINMTGILTKATLSDALRAGFRKCQLEVRHR